MVTFLSEPPSTATAGERQFYNRLKQVFEADDSMLVYFEPAINGLRPDYLILSPKFGAVIVEIKDYSPNCLKTVSKSGSWEKLEAEAVISIKNPFDQIYQYGRAVQDRINHSHFPKDIKIPVTSLVCFSQISGKGEIAEKIKECCPQKTQTCFKETLTRNEKFKEYLSDLLPLNLVIDTENFVRLRSNLIPTCRLPTRGQTNLDEYITSEARVKLLDIEQENHSGRLDYFFSSEVTESIYNLFYFNHL